MEWLPNQSYWLIPQLTELITNQLIELILVWLTNLVAVRCLSLKWKGTVMTASSMSFPPLAWAISAGKTVKLYQKKSVNVNRLINNSIQFCTNLPFNHKAPLLAFCFSELGLKWGLLSKLPNNLSKMILRTSLGEK